MPPPTVSYDKIDHRAADDKEKRGDCLQEETPSAGDERSARLQAVHFISLYNEMKNP